MLGTVSAVCSQPHDAVEHLAPLIEDVYHLVAGLCPQPAQPVIAPLREPVEPGEAEVSQVCNQQCPHRHLCRQITRHHLLVLLWVRLKPDGPPLLASHVERARELARQQTAVPLGDRSQRGQSSRYGVQRTLVYAHHLLGEGCQLLRDHCLKSLSQHAADLLKKPLQWLGSPSMEPSVYRLVRNRKSGEEPEPAFRDETPHGQLVLKASQYADQQSRPQSHCGQNPRPAGTLALVVRLHALQTLLKELFYVPRWSLYRLGSSWTCAAYLLWSVIYCHYPKDCTFLIQLVGADGVANPPLRPWFRMECPGRSPPILHLICTDGAADRLSCSWAHTPPGMGSRPRLLGGRLCAGTTVWGRAVHFQRNDG